MEKIVEVIMGLLKNADWSSIFAILATTIQTLKNMIGIA